MYPSVLDCDSEAALIQAVKDVQISQSTSSSDEHDDDDDDCGSANREESCIPSKLDVSSSSTTLIPSVESEIARLNVLRSYLILDTEKEAAFDQLTLQARQLDNFPWAAVSLVDLGRQWFKSFSGDCCMTETSRKDAFCARTILQEELLIVGDTHQDSRFRENALVTAQPHLRFYAGAPLITPEGHKIGTLCVMDKEPRPNGIGQEEQDRLKELAASVVALMVERRDKFTTDRKRAASVSEVPLREISDSVPATDSGSVDSHAKRSRPNSPVSPLSCTDKDTVTVESSNISLIPKPQVNVSLPDPKTEGVDPDEYLIQLVEAQWGVKLKVKPALELQDFFPVISEKQMASYNMQVVSVARENNLTKLREIHREQGREALDCFNRFGESLLNLACRRGFKEIVSFLLSDDVGLDVRIRDDCGRTPLHDACWHPEPQLEICSWIMQRDPSLFLIADKRGCTPFQYARKSDWNIWRQFLYENRQYLEALTAPEILHKLS